jgi:hypothetical protein
MATEFFRNRWSEEMSLVDRLENDIYAKSNKGDNQVENGNNLFEVDRTVNKEVAEGMMWMVGGNGPTIYPLLRGC